MFIYVIIIMLGDGRRNLKLVYAMAFVKCVPMARYACVSVSVDCAMCVFVSTSHSNGCQFFFNFFLYLSRSVINKN